MHYIYKFTNKINDKIYIGQTNNIEKRKRGHKSTAYNPKSPDYTNAFHNAIRKYGWNNFNFEIVEEIDDSLGQEYVDEREIFFIAYYKSLTSQNGYNIKIGGSGKMPHPKTFEERVACSKVFTIEQVTDIQKMLVDGYAYFEIYQKYPILTNTFLSNIASGLNFYNEKLDYPLGKNKTSYSKAIQDKIIQAIKNGQYYDDIAAEYHISKGYLSEINSGHRWHRDDETYPLCYKACADIDFGKKAIHDLLFTNISMIALGKKYNKSKSTFTAINVGRNRYDDRFLYPLRDNLMANRETWNNLFK